MKNYHCPSCGADLAFRSNLSVYAVCAYCRSMVVRHDVDVESIGTMAALPEDMSPLQIGTEGKYNGERFTLIGRVKMGWEDGAWNEWFFLGDDGRKGWLAEAQGSYAFSYETEESLHANTQKALDEHIAEFKERSLKASADASLRSKGAGIAPGSHLTLSKQKFQITDIKQTECLGSEGELPFSAPKGRKTVSVDLSGDGGEFASIEISTAQTRIYIGRYVEWDDMHCHNLRPLEGW